MHLPFSENIRNRSLGQSSPVFIEGLQYLLPVYSIRDSLSQVKIIKRRPRTVKAQIIDIQTMYR